jgi:hypothetical protein
MYFLLIDSRDRTSSSSGFTDAIFNIKNVPFVDFKRASLISFVIPNLLYSITSSNNKIVFTRGSQHIATITPGNYTINQLSTAIKNAMLGEDSNSYDVTYDSNAQKLTISGSAAFTLNFDQAGTMWRELGFENISTSSATSHVSTNYVNLAMENFVYIQIDELGDHILSTRNTNYGATFYAPLIESKGSLVFQSEGMMQQKIDIRPPKRFEKIRVRILDHTGSIANFNSDWHLYLGLEA